MNIQTFIFALFGGLGIFLYGMRILSDSLQRIAGKRLRKILEMLTKNTFIGVAVGAGITAIVQSSSASTVMVIGLVNAGLMTLRQSICVILGANVGTTITAQIIAFKIHHYALPAIAIGVFLMFFAKRRWRPTGEALLGFGLLFLGLSIMGGAFAPIKESPEFANLFVLFSKNPLLGVLTGAVLTMIVQSSSATVAITMTIASFGLIDFTTAFAIVLGDNIGTTITAQLAALNSSSTAKRAAWAHTLINTFGAAYMLVLLLVTWDGHPAFLTLINKFTPGNVWAGMNIERHIANSHTFFNIINVVLFMPLVGFLVYVVKKIVPGDGDVVERGAKFLDEKLLATPAIALAQVKKEMVRTARISLKMIRLSVNAALEPKEREQERLIKKVDDREAAVDELEEEITGYIVKIDQGAISEQEARDTASYLHIVHDIERVGDLSVNITDLVKLKSEQGAKFSDTASQDLLKLSNEAELAFATAIEALEKEDTALAQKTLEIEEQVDQSEQSMRDGHIGRLNKGKCAPTTGVVFLDIISNLERVGDHATNIAQRVLGKV